ncbi:hypothetical protein SUGI_0823310 [Cryptomeria japonica]|nr:hypothetical protein SUGI_0823310 [Cryptomeria japonica]
MTSKAAGDGVMEDRNKDEQQLSKGSTKLSEKGDDDPHRLIRVKLIGAGAVHVAYMLQTSNEDKHTATGGSVDGKSQHGLQLIGDAVAMVQSTGNDDGSRNAGRGGDNVGEASISASVQDEERVDEDVVALAVGDQVELRLDGEVVGKGIIDGVGRGVGWQEESRDGKVRKEKGY